jgi:hypothetical protein
VSTFDEQNWAVSVSAITLIALTRDPDNIVTKLAGIRPCHPAADFNGLQVWGSYGSTLVIKSNYLPSGHATVVATGMAAVFTGWAVLGA